MFKKNRKTEADGLSRGCEIFQQKNTCDRFLHGAQNKKPVERQGFLFCAP